MLEAVARGKFDAGLVTEDLLTSALFGAVRTMAVPAQGEVLDLVLGQAPGAAPLSGASRIEVRLWPRLDRDEPDVTLAAVTPGGILNVLVEIKWGADLGEWQLDRYVAALEARHGPLHRVVLLGYEAGHEPRLQAQPVRSGMAVERRSWREVARAARVARGSGGMLGEFADQLFRFLKRTTRGAVFDGFAHLTLQAPELVRWSCRQGFARPCSGVVAVQRAFYSYGRRNE